MFKPRLMTNFNAKSMVYPWDYLWDPNWLTSMAKLESGSEASIIDQFFVTAKSFVIFFIADCYINFFLHEIPSN